MRRLFITGASGLLGQHVARRALAGAWEVVGTFHTAPLDLPIAWRRLDITDADAVAAAIADDAPDAIVHTAFLQRGPRLWATTAVGAANVALAATRARARLVHISSDMVFSGTAAPYDEAAPPDPISPYGAAKAAAETAVPAVAPTAAVVRTSLIMSHEPMDQHQRLVLDVLERRQEVRFFVDEVRCPVAVEDLAAAVLELIVASVSGPVHVAGPESISRYHLAQLVARAHHYDPDAVPAGRLLDSGLHRPPDLRLDVRRAQSLMATRLRPVSAYLGQRA